MGSQIGAASCCTKQMPWHQLITFVFPSGLDAVPRWKGNVGEKEPISASDAVFVARWWHIFDGHMCKHPIMAQSWFQTWSVHPAASLHGKLFAIFVDDAAGPARHPTAITCGTWGPSKGCSRLPTAH
jgi:hypothetical protein